METVEASSVTSSPAPRATRRPGAPRGAAYVLHGFLGQPWAMAGAIVILFYLLAALLAGILPLRDPLTGSVVDRLMPPAWEEGGEMAHLFGTDLVGRDLLARIVYGARTSLWIGSATVLIAVVVGVVLGSAAGYYRSWADATFSRFADLLLAFPMLIFAIGVLTMMGPGIGNLIFALAFKSWVEFFRLARGEILAERAKDYVDAARVLGASDGRIVVGHLWPNIFVSILVLATLRLGYLIVTEASLSFLGLGVQPPTPAWGSMVAEGRQHLLTAWWLSTAPGLVILVLVLAINLVGEGLRDVLDPRQRGR